jgi:hypothetical protein
MSSLLSVVREGRVLHLTAKLLAAKVAHAVEPPMGSFGRSHRTRVLKNTRSRASDPACDSRRKKDGTSLCQGTHELLTL